MLQNEAGWDRAARVIIGLALLGFVSLPMSRYWGLLGLIPLLTGLTGYSPLYHLFRMDTRRLFIHRDESQPLH